MPNEPITREELAVLFEQIATALRNGATPPPTIDGFSTSETTSAPANGSHEPRDTATPSTVRSWSKVRELEGQTYTWPAGTEEYDPFEVWQTQDVGERLQLGLGYVAADPAADYYG